MNTIFNNHTKTIIRNKYFINQQVLTPDGEGRVTRIAITEDNELLYSCLLKRPYKIVHPYLKWKEYGFLAYSFGYDYAESSLSLLSS